MPVGHLQAEILEENFNVLTMHYYSNPQPEKIPAVLKAYLASEFFNSDQPTDFYASVSYLLGRIARAEPSLIPEYIKIFEDATHRGRVFLIMVFQICGNEQVTEYLRSKLDDKAFASEKSDIENTLKKGIPISYDPLEGEVKSGVDLDALWAEFFVTGNKEPIVKIIDVLGKVDLFKKKLVAWMSNQHTKREIKNLNALLNSSNLHVDLEQNKLDIGSDMDCMYSSFLSASGRHKERSRNGVQIRKILSLSEKDLIYMANKGAAMWSLQSNAEQHPKVFEYCKQEFERRNDKAKIELAIILEVVAKGTVELVPTEEEDIFTLKLHKENN